MAPRLYSSALVLFLITFSTAAFSFGQNFPTGPDPRLTPGKICDKPTAYRYPEHIAYCERDVTYETKEELIQRYDRELGFHIQTMNRDEFKIDHYIPLCAGGSNDVSNLWPQHKSVYEITDPVEPLVCGKMAQGRLSQAQAIQYIIKAKNNLQLVPAVIRALQQL